MMILKIPHIVAQKKVTVCENSYIHPILRFVPWAFVLVNFSDPSMYHVWLGRVEYDVVRDVESEHYIKVLVQW
jgi:hypothetical protein